MRLMTNAESSVRIVPGEDGAYTVVSSGERVWRKRYSSMEEATSESVELQIMTGNDKGLADMSQPVPTYAQGFAAPSVEIDVDELIKRGFMLDA